MDSNTSETANGSACLVDARKELLGECESIWKQIEEYQSKLVIPETEKQLNLGDEFSLLMMQAKALTTEYKQWQERSPEIISVNPDVLLASGEEALQNVKIDLERLLSTLQSKNTQLEEDLKREQQWHDEQEQVVEALNRIEEETKAQVAQLSKKSINSNTSVLTELQNQTLKLKTYKEELLNALNEFLEEHFPIPENGGRAKRKNSSEEPATELIKLNDILEILTNKLMNTPHEPYVTISKSFWPPYIELLLRFGIALRHPEDPNRIRLQHFHV